MESSEDDAGTATSASRRASAREKDVGLAVDVGATGSFQQEPSDARPSCRTPAMSEENFDGDSVPSPSSTSHDVNTSTEAILDMIDEIVDGPGAPKRLPLPPGAVDAPHNQLATTADTHDIVQKSTQSVEIDKSLPPEVASVAADVKSEGSQPADVFESQPQVQSPCEDAPKADINTGSVNFLQASSPVAASEPTVSPQLECSETSSVKPEVPADCPPNIPSSSEEQTVQRISDSSECETQERTVKCVTSSDNRDNVTVESAESTSSDSVSEGKAVLVEPQTRSPLRRRLVRPVVCDRRPDSTVSSTVDSHTVDIHTIDPTDSIAKDVSSSSDAVPTIHGNLKPEEIRNISEISICKAETSVSPPKKIKLIRQKNIAGSSNRETPHNQTIVTKDKDQCQSTSSDNQSSALPDVDQSSGPVGLPQPLESTEKPLPNKDSHIERVAVQSAEPICSDEHSQPIKEQSHQSSKSDDDRENDSKQVPPLKLGSPVTNLPGASSNSKTSSITQENSVCVLTTSEIPSNTKINDFEQGKKCDEEHSNKIDLEQVQKKVLPLKLNLASSNSSSSINCDGNNVREDLQDNIKKVPPIKLNLSLSSPTEPKIGGEQHTSISKSNETHEQSETKQVPKLTIKLKQSEELKSPVPKLTIKPIRPPVEQNLQDIIDNVQPVPSVTRLNIKPILKPPGTNEKTVRTHQSTGVDKFEVNEQIPCITKLNIKAIRKPPEKINDVHRKSSSSEISESEYSENDESTSTSDQTSASEHGPTDVIPKVTIKLGKPGTQSEGKFYTEQNIPKLTIKGIQQDDKQEEEPKLKLVISQAEDKQPEKIPKLTIKTVGKSESQPLSPKLTIKQLRPSDSHSKESEIPKLKITTESFSDARENAHVPKITIKPVTRLDTDTISRTPKRSMTTRDSPEHIPVVTKLNIKPILKPVDCEETSEDSDDKVPVVSKLNIKPVVKPKDNDVDSSVIDDVPKITKLNIKPIKDPEENSSEEKDCDELNADLDANSIPVITKLNIKPIVKPQEDESLKDTENQSSETGNSSDENTDHIPVVTKLNIKPILKPDNLEESSKSVSSSEPTIPVITKLNIKPLVKPGESSSPSSPKKEHMKSPDLHNTSIPNVTKLNIKPVVKPEDAEIHKPKDDVEGKTVKNPPLVMKINMKSVIESVINESQLHSEYNKCNNVGEEKLSTDPKPTKSAIESEINKSVTIFSDNKSLERLSSDPGRSRASHSPIEKQPKQNCVAGFGQESEDRPAVISKSPVNKSRGSSVLEKQSSQESLNVAKSDSLLMIAPLHDGKLDKSLKLNKVNEKSPEVINTNIKNADTIVETNIMETLNKPKFSSVQNCTLLKKLLENTKEGLDRTLDVSKQAVMNCALLSDKPEPSESSPKNVLNREQVDDTENYSSEKNNSEIIHNIERRTSPNPDTINDTSISTESIKLHKNKDFGDKVNENVTKPLEITISDKITNQGSGQDSPRIILKINKTDHGSSAKIITEDTKRPDTLQPPFKNTQDTVNDKSPKMQLINSRRKQPSDTILSLSAGKRLRSSRIVENTEKTPIVRRNLGKRPSITETSPPQSKEPELSALQTKRLKLGQLLSGNKSLTITPVSISTQTSPTKTGSDMKQGVKTVNHSLLNNENCSKNGNSKLHNILSNLQAKQMQTLSYNNANCSDKTQSVSSPVELNSQQSTGSSDTVEITLIENSHPELQEMIINENSDFRDFSIGPEESSQDPLEVPNLRTTDGANDDLNIPKPVEMTPQPKKRGRPRKLPLSEGAKPAAAATAAKPPAVTLPVSALEERPQRSLRLMRDRPAILLKPRGGRGRGRGARRVDATPPAEPELEPEPEPAVAAGEIDPTSSRIKLPRMTEALDKMPVTCSTPLSSRRAAGDAPELKVVLESTLPKLEEIGKSPESVGAGRARGARGGRGRPARAPRGRGRGRGGGRGAMYMKETMGIYGRVCGPATTTVQLFEEETCMMDDNATPAKSSHLLDEDSQSSVKSSTNESSKMKKSKFADLFDSNKVWTAADVKEYMWPPSERPDMEPKVMMIQEQVAMFLGVKSFKRRYPELQRRAVAGAEREFLLKKDLVTEPLCDLGITAVDASEVLDIMLSDYPHKYEEYRCHQRERQLNQTEETVEEVKTDDKVLRVEMKIERIIEPKPEVPKVDPEKTRQDMAAAAIASASEWNARANASRRGACVDLQSHTVQRPRPRQPPPPRPHVRPPAGFYPHALLPGQYQHWCRLYTPEQLRYFPLNTALAAPPSPAAASSSDSEPDWPPPFSDSADSDAPAHHAAKRKKLSKVKRSSQAERAGGHNGQGGAGGQAGQGGQAGPGGQGGQPEAEGEADTCRACGLRLEANRKYTHERFLVCAHCNSKLHPGCVELSADTIRKCREYAWQCAECKSCGACRRPADDDKMLFCDLCDRGFHIYCVGLASVPSGRWHCVECAICKSCGARSPGGLAANSSTDTNANASTSASVNTNTSTSTSSSGLAEWHHQTRRGPGGHKVYSHSLCTPCARAYRIGRYCPLCERSFIGPKGTMQLVICKLCDRQLHQDCVKQTVTSLRVLDYTCGSCRRGGITSRAAAVRLAPRTIATLFMAKRRFNKYAHRQYMESRRRQDPPDTPDTHDASEPHDPHDTSDTHDTRDPHDASESEGGGDASDPLDGLGDP